MLQDPKLTGLEDQDEAAYLNLMCKQSPYIFEYTVMINLFLSDYRRCGYEHDDDLGIP